MQKAIAILLKALSLFPVVVEVVGNIEAARDPESPGGAKVTPAELAKVIADGVEKLGKALAALFAKG